MGKGLTEGLLLLLGPLITKTVATGINKTHTLVLSNLVTNNYQRKTHIKPEIDSLKKGEDIISTSKLPCSVSNSSSIWFDSF